MGTGRTPRWWWIAAPAVAAGILILIFAVPAWTANSLIRSRLESELSRELHRRVSIGRLAISVVHGWLDAKELTIAEAPGFGAEPLLRVADLRVRLHFLPLVFGKVRISSIHISGPSVRLLRNRQGVWNVSSPRPPRPVLPKSVQVGAVSVRGARIITGTLTSLADKVRFEASLNARRITLKGAFPVSVQAGMQDNGIIRAEGSIGPLDHDPQRAPIEIHVVGTKLRAVDLAHLVEAFGYRVSGFTIASGLVTTRARLEGTLAAPRVAAQVLGNEVQLTNLQLGKAGALAKLGMTGGAGRINIHTLQAALDFSIAGLRLRKLNASTNFGTVQASGLLHSNGQLRFRIRIHLNSTPHKSGPAGLVGALVRLFRKAKSANIELEIAGNTKRVHVESLQ